MCSSTPAPVSDRSGELEAVRVLAQAALSNLESHRQRIDDLNVYPVPDGDTGTNLVHTARGIVDAIAIASSSDRRTLAAGISHAALGKSKGNSGVILSQIVRGFCDVLGSADEVNAPVLSGAFRAGSDAAYGAVRRVGAVEGTILTVIREMAEEGEKHEHQDLSPPEFLQVVLARGEDALARTPQLLPILGEVGVVDAGGAGLVELVRGVTLAASGQPLPSAPETREDLGFDAIHRELSRYRYCTGFVVQGNRLDAVALEDELAQLGDSLLVVGDESMLKVHVHTDDPGRALAAATAIGVIDDVEIANMHAQTEARERRLLGGGQVPLPAFETGLVAVTPGRGIRALFESEHAVVVEGGQTANPSVEEIVEAIERTPAPDVIVLPNNSNVILAAEQAAQLVHTKRVRILPSRSVQAGWAALGRYVSTSSAEENESAMREALDSIATGEVTTAVRDAELDGVTISDGAYLGLVDGKPVVSGDDLGNVALEVVERVLEGGQGWLGLLVGESTPAVDGLVSAVESAHPDVEVEVHEGGQPHYPLLIVAE